MTNNEREEYILAELHAHCGVCGHCGKRGCVGRAGNSVLPMSLPRAAVLESIERGFKMTSNTTLTGEDRRLEQ